MKKTVADILIEALPYIKKFYGNTIVIKYGGHAMVDKTLKEDFARDIVLLKFIGFNPIIVHGGGPQINKVLDKMGIDSNFIRGIRFTDAETMDVVEMVLGGKVNKEIVAQINKEGGKAIGLSGKDANLIIAEKMEMVHKQENAPPEIIDTGLVGKVKKINVEIIKTLSAKGFIPIIAPIGTDEKAKTYNINADFVASNIAMALSAEKLILLTDVDGVLDKDKKLVSSATIQKMQTLIKENIVIGGMIPKIECAIEFAKKKIGKVHIINGAKKHALLLELFTNQGIGTEITNF